MNNDIKAKKALKCVSYVIEYMNNEESWASNTEFVDTKGYAMSCNLGYFYQGLTNLKDMLIKRLRGGIPKYQKLCEKYNEGGKGEDDGAEERV